MNKFWEWMRINKYGHLQSIDEKEIIPIINETEICFKKQMLIGYMIEYLLIDKWKKSYIKDILEHYMYSIDELYKYLESEISQED